MSAASVRNTGETRPSLPSSGGLTAGRGQTLSLPETSLCQAAAPIFELMFPGLNPLSLWAPSSASRKRSPRLRDPPCCTRCPPPPPFHPSREHVFIKRWIRNITRQVTGCQAALSGLKIQEGALCVLVTAVRMTAALYLHFTLPTAPVPPAGAFRDTVPVNKAIRRCRNALP